MGRGTGRGDQSVLYIRHCRARTRRAGSVDGGECAAGERTWSFGRRKACRIAHRQAPDARAGPHRSIRGVLGRDESAVGGQAHRSSGAPRVARPDLGRGRSGLRRGAYQRVLVTGGWSRDWRGRIGTDVGGRARSTAFPEVPSFKSAPTKIQAGVIKTFIDRTIFAITQEESRYTLSGAKFVLDETGARMDTTDGHRL